MHDSLLYNVTGSINTAFILLSLLGVGAQWQKIQRRKRAVDSGGQATAILSLNQFTVSFLAYFSFFVYGYTIEPFNHYMVWPRLAASVLVLLILWEIWRDRRSGRAAWACGLAGGILLAGFAGLIWGERYSDQGRLVSATLIVVITVLLAQGYAHQISLIWRSGRTGAVSLRMNLLILLMDLSTVAFATAMGLAVGWPLMLLACVSGATKLVILGLFRWERVSRSAALRRAAWAPLG